jgi:hypothetical protein
MAKKNVVGMCRLCLKRKILCKSHYIGRGIHILNRQDGEDPILMTPKVILATQRQLWAHLLCNECEERLNKYGETPTMRWLDNGKAFPLLERMNVAHPIKEENDVVTFSGSAMGVDTEPFGHFVLGLMWKGAVRQWPTAEGQTTSIELGDFGEPVRKYLLGGAPFPKHVYVLLAVCDDKGSRGMVFAPTLMKETKHQMFSVLVRGLWFHVIADKKASAGNRALCCVQSDKKVIHLENCEKRFLHAGGHIHKTARVAPNVRKKS